MPCKAMAHSTKYLLAMYLQNIKLSSVLKNLLYDNVALWTYLYQNIEELE